MPEIYPIGGGKGGVGKSFVAASLGALIAKSGNSVLLIDLDLGASNLHTLLGIKNPKRGISNFLNQRAVSLETVAVPTNVPNLFFISSFHCPMEIANLFYAQKIKLIKAIRKLPFDYILLDLGAGSNFNTLDFFLTATKGICVFSPEPTSIENAFRFIKAAYLRRLKRIIKQGGFNTRVKKMVFRSGRKDLDSSDIIDIVSTYDPDNGRPLKDKLERFDFKFILNQFRKNSDTTLGEKVEIVCNRHFYSPFQYIGSIGFDERVLGAVFSKKLYIQKYPYTSTSVDLKNIADALTSRRPQLSGMANLS
ncbi:AAA family ATPase [Thermodesulfobacteriota bacterium]